MSSPLPPSITLLPSPPVMVSLPSPPLMTAGMFLPAVSKVMVSSPLPPLMTNLRTFDAGRLPTSTPFMVRSNFKVVAL